MNGQNHGAGQDLPEPLCHYGKPTLAELGIFRDIVLTRYRSHGRVFPWRETSDPYHILLSEMMLQQTQTERVLPKYLEFLDRWPDLTALDQAPLIEILASWKGLGYNRRALALKRIAAICAEQGGELPCDEKGLRELPMVGPATAAAVMAFAYHHPALYLETNIRRVLIHFFFADCDSVHDRDLYRILEQAIQDPTCDPKSWYYALMDYGVFLRRIIKNPNRRSAHYSRQSSFENSDRQIRGRLIMILTESGSMSLTRVLSTLDFPEERIGQCLSALEKEGFIEHANSERVGEGEPIYRIRDSI